MITPRLNVKVIVLALSLLILTLKLFNYENQDSNYY